jgi:hypothetical protein
LADTSLRDNIITKHYYVLVLFLDIPWPVGEEALSEAARNAVEGLLSIDPNQRLMSPGRELI